MIRPANTSTKVSGSVKRDVESKASDVIGNVLKPKHVMSAQDDERFNCVSDLGTNWYRHYFYFIATCTCPSRNALSPTFESRFAKLQYPGGSKFAMYFMRHTRGWVGVYGERSVDECIEAVQN
ncbi:MAG: hypothetical protein O3B13_20415 [Planctomycetota bacterium]|nr:hypothetical protein [Planctomycetota bacterium]